MIFIVYVTEGVVCFVCHELNKLLEYLRSSEFQRVDIWKGTRHVGSYFK